MIKLPIKALTTYRKGTYMSNDTNVKKPKFSDEAKTRIAAATKRRWQDPEYKAKMLETLHKGSRSTSEKKKEAGRASVAKFRAENPLKQKEIGVKAAKMNLHTPEGRAKSNEASLRARALIYEEVGYTPGMKGLCMARNLKEKNITYADIANAYLKYAKQGHLPFKICNLIAEEFDLPSLTTNTLKTWANNGHSELKEAIEAGKQYIAMAHVDYMRKGLGIDKVKWMLNVFCGIYETSAMKHDINGSLEVNGKIEVKVKTLADIRKTLGK